MLAKRLKIDLLELDLPFWINNTIEFIEKVWDFFKISENKVKKFIFNELNVKNNIDSIKWTINKVFLNKKITYYVDPYLYNGMVDFSDFLWMEVNQVFIHWYEKHLGNNIKKIDINFPENLFFWLKNIVPKKSDLYIINSANKYNWLSWGDKFSKINSDSEIDLIKNYNIFNFWFPSYYNHYFVSRPYYGIKWSLNFITDIYNKLNY